MGVIVLAILSAQIDDSGYEREKEAVNYILKDDITVSDINELITINFL